MPIPDTEKPSSHIPVTLNLGWWKYQDALAVTNLLAEPVEPHLDLFNSSFLARYQIQGTLQSEKTRRPYLKEVQVFAHLVSLEVETDADESDPFGPAESYRANILIVPVVDVKQDDSYEGEEITFNIKIEHLLETMGWGDNIFEVTCGTQKRNFSVYHTK